MTQISIGREIFQLVDKVFVVFVASESPLGVVSIQQTFIRMGFFVPATIAWADRAAKIISIAHSHSSNFQRLLLLLHLNEASPVAELPTSKAPSIEYETGTAHSISSESFIKSRLERTRLQSLSSAEIEILVAGCIQFSSRDFTGFYCADGDDNDRVKYNELLREANNPMHLKTTTNPTIEVADN